MAKPGEYDFNEIEEYMMKYVKQSTVSVGIFQWVYKIDGKNLKKSKSVYRVKGPAHRWQEINERARCLCNAWNSVGTVLDSLPFKKKKSETI